jgi:hypothetical protein
VVLTNCIFILNIKINDTNLLLGLPDFNGKPVLWGGSGGLRAVR